MERTQAAAVAMSRKGESFSKVIDRLLDEVDAAHTGSDILRRLAGFPALPEEDAKAMLAVVDEDRRGETWAELPPACDA